jgi:hypothetical protein
MKDQLKHLLEYGWFPTVYMLVIPTLMVVVPPLFGKPIVPQAPLLFVGILFGMVGAMLAIHNVLCTCKKSIPWAPHAGWACILVVLLVVACLK